MAPSATMLESAAYARMRAEHPAEFVPRRVFFTHERDSEIDRGNSLLVKAALVYEAITGHDVDGDTMAVAHDLLLALAKDCCSRIPPTQKKEVAGNQASAPQSGTEDRSAISVSSGEAQASINQGEKTTALPDEGSDENKQVIDGIFLVVGFLPRLRKAASRDAADESFKSANMQDIVTDVIKLENQLPLKHLIDVVEHVEAAIHGAAKEFRRLEAQLKGYKLSFAKETFHEVIHSFCWYYSPFFNKNEAAAVQGSQFKNVAGDAKMAARTLLDCLHASLVPPRAPEGKGAGGGGGGKTSRMPTARELSRSGVRLVAGDDGSAVVDFSEQGARLRLPALVYDFKLATVARNLLAREYEEQSKPVTRYFQMMNELVDEVADVRILLRAGVVRGGSGGAHEVHKLVKRIDGYAAYPSVFMAMDLQIEKVKRFHDGRMKNFFVRHRPGVIWVSSVAAVSVVAIVAARRNRV